MSKKRKRISEDFNIESYSDSRSGSERSTRSDRSDKESKKKKTKKNSNKKTQPKKPKNRDDDDILEYIGSSVLTQARKLKKQDKNLTHRRAVAKAILLHNKK